MTTKKTFNKIRQDIELVFDKYRKHKYYTLFIDTYNVSVTSKIDEIGGGCTNQISDKTANTAIKIADKKQKAKEFVELVERAVDQLPEIEKKLIKERYMCREYKYIYDYNVEMKLNLTRPTYVKIRDNAFEALSIMLF